MKRFGRLAIAILLVSVALAYLVYAGTRRNLTYYYTVDELLAAEAPPASRVRISGDVVAGSVERDDATRALRFRLEDPEEGGGGTEVPVVYGGPVPDIFRPGIQVVVEGRLDESGTFRAETLLAKCPSKYQAAGQLGQPAGS